MWKDEGVPFSVEELFEKGHKHMCQRSMFGKSREGTDSPKNFFALAAPTKELLVAWIKDNMIPRKTANTRHTSYGLKHMFEQDAKVYVSNGAFKGATIAAGIPPRCPGDINWVYAIKTIKRV